MAYSFQTFSVNEVLTATKMNQVEVNIRDHVHGSAGVVSIAAGGLADGAVDTSGRLAANVVTWGKISTASQTTSASVDTDFSFTGGARTLGWGLGSSGTFKGEMDGYFTSGGSIFGGRLISGGGTTYWAASYINSSPPWDMGDGDIPLFVFALVDALGNVINLDVSEAPPWAYNGPTDLTPYREVGSRKYRRVKAILAEFGTPRAAVRSGLTRAQVLDRLMTDSFVDQEITHALKNADMGLIPSPLLTVPVGHTLILLDPVSALVRRLSVLHRINDVSENVDKLLRAGQINIGNTPLARVAPPGVMVVSAKLK